MIDPVKLFCATFLCSQILAESSALDRNGLNDNPVPQPDIPESGDNSSSTQENNLFRLIDAESRRELIDIIENTNLTRAESQKQMEKWVGEQKNPQVQVAYKKMKDDIDNHRQQYRFEHEKQVANITPDAKVVDAQIQAVIDSDDRTLEEIYEDSRTIYENATKSIQDQLAIIYPQLHVNHPISSPQSIQRGQSEEVQQVAVNIGEKGGQFSDIVKDDESMSSRGRTEYGQPPSFLDLVSTAAKIRYWEIANNPNLTKVQWKASMDNWADQQNATVQTAYKNYMANILAIEERELQEHKTRVAGLSSAAKDLDTKIQGIFQNTNLTRAETMNQVNAALTESPIAVRQELLAAVFNRGKGTKPTN